MTRYTVAAYMALLHALEAYETELGATTNDNIDCEPHLITNRSFKWAVCTRNLVNYWLRVIARVKWPSKGYTVQNGQYMCKNLRAHFISEPKRHPLPEDIVSYIDTHNLRPLLTYRVTTTYQIVDSNTVMYTIADTVAIHGTPSPALVDPSPTLVRTAESTSTEACTVPITVIKLRTSHSLSTDRSSPIVTSNNSNSVPALIESDVDVNCSATPVLVYSDDETQYSDSSHLEDDMSENEDDLSLSQSSLETLAALATSKTTNNNNPGCANPTKPSSPHSSTSLHRQRRREPTFDDVFDLIANTDTSPIVHVGSITPSPQSPSISAHSVQLPTKKRSHEVIDSYSQSDDSNAEPSAKRRCLTTETAITESNVIANSSEASITNNVTAIPLTTSTVQMTESCIAKVLMHAPNIINMQWLTEYTSKFWYLKHPLDAKDALDSTPYLTWFYDPQVLLTLHVNDLCYRLYLIVANAYAIPTVEWLCDVLYDVVCTITDSLSKEWWTIHAAQALRTSTVPFPGGIVQCIWNILELVLTAAAGTRSDAVCLKLKSSFLTHPLYYLPSSVRAQLDPCLHRGNAAHQCSESYYAALFEHAAFQKWAFGRHRLWPCILNEIALYRTCHPLERDTMTWNIRNYKLLALMRMIARSQCQALDAPLILAIVENVVDGYKDTRIELQHMRALDALLKI